jgi:hypothetical protein
MGMDSIPVIVALTAMVLALVGTMSAIPVFWQMPNMLLSGGAAAVGVALINSVANLAGFGAPYLMGVIKASTGKVAPGLYLVAIVEALAAVLAIAFVACIQRRKNAEGVIPHASHPHRPRRAGSSLSGLVLGASALTGTHGALAAGPGSAGPGRRPHRAAWCQPAPDHACRGHLPWLCSHGLAHRLFALRRRNLCADTQLCRERQRPRRRTAADRRQLPQRPLRNAAARGRVLCCQGRQLPRPAFLSKVPVRFQIVNTAERIHLPIQFGPWSYTYSRGS